MNNVKQIEAKKINNLEVEVIDSSLETKEELWKKVNKIRNKCIIYFYILGSALHKLYKLYAAYKSGSFEKEYKSRGFKKNEVHTLMTKYIIYEEFKVENNFIVCSANNKSELTKVLKRLEVASQRTTGCLKKLSIEDRARFLRGEISSSEMKEISKNTKIKKTTKSKKILPFYNSLNDFRRETYKIKDSDYSKVMEELEDVKKMISEITENFQSKAVNPIS